MESVCWGNSTVGSNPTLSARKALVMKSRAKSVEEYLSALPAERKQALSAVRKVILENLPKEYEEAMSAGLIA